MSSCNVTLQFLPQRVINKIEFSVFSETAIAGLECVVGLIQVVPWDGGAWYAEAVRRNE